MFPMSPTSTIRRFGSLHLTARMSLALAALTAFRPVEVEAQTFDTQFQIAYKIVQVSGETDKWFIHFKMVNKKAVWDVWAFEVSLPEGAVGTSETTQPEWWQGEPTVDGKGTTRGMIFATLTDSTEVMPGETKTGFSWKVCSPTPPVPNALGFVYWEHKDNSHGGSKLVKLREDKGQTESASCEAPETHGFTRQTTSPTNGFEVVSDVYIHGRDCALAVGDVIGPPKGPFTASVDSPLLDFSNDFDPVVEFSHVFQGVPEVAASVEVSTDGGAQFTPVAFYPGCPDPPTCAMSGRVSLSVPEVAGSPSAVVRWSFGWGPQVRAGVTAARGGPDPSGSFWVIDDLLILGDPPPTEQTVGVPAPVPEPPAVLAVHPNPFVRATTISWDLDRGGPARVSIYDVAGRHVRTVLDAHLSAGPGRSAWDGVDARGRRAPPGVYVVELAAGERVLNEKIVLAR